MRTVLFCLCVVTGLLGVATLAVAQSAVHEVLAGIAFLTSAVLLVGGSLLMSLQDLRDHLVDDEDDEEDEPAPRRPAPAKGRR